MSDVAINQVLAQMRTMTSAIATEGASPLEATPGPNFGELMKNSIQEVNDSMQTSRAMADAFEAGDPSVSLAQMMVQSQKASLEFTALSEVRNKLLSAYQEVMNMQV